MSKCRFCQSLTEYEICGVCIKCPLCGGPSIEGELNDCENIFQRKHFGFLHGECLKCVTGFFRKWEITKSLREGFNETDLVEIGAFTHSREYVSDEEPKQVEDILKRPPPPSSGNLGRFRALLIVDEED